MPLASSIGGGSGKSGRTEGELASRRWTGIRLLVPCGCRRKLRIGALAWRAAQPPVFGRRAPQIEGTPLIPFQQKAESRGPVAAVALRESHPGPLCKKTHTVREYSVGHLCEQIGKELALQPRFSFVLQAAQPQAGRLVLRRAQVAGTAAAHTERTC